VRHVNAALPHCSGELAEAEFKLREALAGRGDEAAQLLEASAEQTVRYTVSVSASMRYGRRRILLARLTTSHNVRGAEGDGGQARRQTR